SGVANAFRRLTPDSPIGLLHKPRLRPRDAAVYDEVDQPKEQIRDAGGRFVTPEECLVIYGEAWFERDPARRVEVLRRCCTEDIVFMGTELGRLQGLEAVSDMIGRAIGGMSRATPDEAPEPSTAERRGRSGGGVADEVVTRIEQ